MTTASAKTTSTSSGATFFRVTATFEELRQRIGRALDELSAWHMIVRYEHATTGRQYFAVANWHHPEDQSSDEIVKAVAYQRQCEDCQPFPELLRSNSGVLSDPLRPDLGNKGAREQGSKGSGEGEGGGWFDDEPRCDEHRNIPHPPHACKRVREQRETQRPRPIHRRPTRRPSPSTQSTVRHQPTGATAMNREDIIDILAAITAAVDRRGLDPVWWTQGQAACAV